MIYYPAYSQIIKGVFLGNSDAALDPKTLQLLDVSHILVAGKDLEQHYPLEYKYKQIPLLDSATQNISQYFEECSDFIEEGSRDKGVLIHCRYGISRSATLLIAYIMRKKRQGLRCSFYQVKRRSDIINPNSGFKKQLFAYQKTLGLSVKP